MEIIELRHEVCYRSLEELLEDVCPKSSMIALSSVRIKSNVPPLKTALAILSEIKLIVVHDIQDAIDYTSADNLMLIDVDDMKAVKRANGQMTLLLADDSEIVLQESSLETELRQIGGFDTSFSTLCAALQELVGTESDEAEVPEPIPVSAPVAIPVTFTEPTTTAREESPSSEEKTKKQRRLGWFLLALLAIICAGLYFIPWSNTSVTQSPVVEAVTATNEEANIDQSNPVVEESSFSNEVSIPAESTENTPIVPAGDKKVLKASSFKETIYGEVWPMNWTSPVEANKNVSVKVTSKGSLYQVEYVVNGALKQTLFVVPNKKRSQELAADLSVGKVNSYSNPSSDEAVHVDVINGTLDELIANSGDLPELHISIESASYAAAFRF